MKKDKNIRVILLLVFSSFFINVYTFTSLSHLFKYALNFELFKNFSEVFTYSDSIFLKRFLMYFYTSTFSGITVFFIHKKVSLLNYSKTIKALITSLTVFALITFSILLHLIFIERYGWDFEISYTEYIFRRVMWYSGRTISVSVIAIYMVYFTIQKDKEKDREADIHELKIRNIKSKYLILREQLNPNFIFNAVNNLNLLILDTPDLAKSYLSALSKLLRGSMSENEFTTIENEVELISSLATIYSYEKRNNIKIENNIDENIYNLYIPTMTMSNIVNFAYKMNFNFDANTINIEITSTYNSILLKIKSEKNIFKNNFQPFVKQISERYFVISNKNISINKQSGLVTFDLPL